MAREYDIWLKNGTDEFVVIPMKDYQAMRERLEDDADFRAIEASKKRQAKSRKTPLAEVKRQLGITAKRGRSRS